MERTISKAEINEKPLLQYDGDLTVVASDKELQEVLPTLRRETLLGFDTETRPAFRKGESYLPSILQLGGENHVWLFYLTQINDLNSLFSILADPNIIKSGVAIDRDILELKDLAPFQEAGFRDLGKMAEDRLFRKTGLRPLAAMLLDGRVSKGAQVSNWAKLPLSRKQITYAATDAWVSRRLYLSLLDIRP